MYREFLSKTLNIKVDSLRDELDLKLTLKARLTKKELKILNALINGGDIKELCNRLNIDKKRYIELKSRIDKKLKKIDFKRNKTTQS
jgi:DNA-binding NarL/FixJ family response regulator